MNITKTSKEIRGVVYGTNTILNYEEDTQYYKFRTKYLTVIPEFWVVKIVSHNYQSMMPLHWKPLQKFMKENKKPGEERKSSIFSILILSQSVNFLSGG